MVWWIPVAMAVAGALEADEKRKRNEKKLQAQAEIARWSPWTELKPHDVSTEDNALHGAMQGGVAGIGMMQNMKGDGAEPDPALTSDAGASSEPYSRPADTSNMSLSPPPAAAQAAPAPAQAAPAFNTQATPQESAQNSPMPWMHMMGPQQYPQDPSAYPANYPLQPYGPKRR